MIASALRQALSWVPVLCLALVAAALTAIPGNTVTFLLDAAQPLLTWTRP